MLEQAPERAFGPAHPLSPQAGPLFDRFLPDLDVERPHYRDPCRRSDPDREVEVFGQRLGSPATDGFEELATNDDAVATELGAATPRPPATLDLAVNGLLVGLGLGEDTRPGAEHAPATGDGVRPGRDIR